MDFESDYRKPVYKTVVFSELNKNETYLNPRIKCDILSEREFPKEEMKLDKLLITGCERKYRIKKAVIYQRSFAK